MVEGGRVGDRGTQVEGCSHDDDHPYLHPRHPCIYYITPTVIPHYFFSLYSYLPVVKSFSIYFIFFLTAYSTHGMMAVMRIILIKALFLLLYLFLAFPWMLTKMGHGCEWLLGRRSDG